MAVVALRLFTSIRHGFVRLLAPRDDEPPAYNFSRDDGAAVLASADALAPGPGPANGLAVTPRSA
jgi:hypothetical protein